MYYYFSSNQKIALKFNGVYYGVSFPNSAKGLNVESDSVFVEIFPVDGNGEPVNFLLNESFLSCPPQTVSVTDLRGGYLINVCPKQKPNPFKIIKQGKFSGCNVTLFCDNGLKFSIETQNDFFAEGLDFYSETADIDFFYLEGEPFIYIFFNDLKTFYVYRLNSTVQCVLSKKVSDFSVKNGLFTTETLHDMAKHVIKTEWIYKEGTLHEKEKLISCSDNFDKNGLSEKLIPFAFTEEYVINGDYTFYLSQNMQKNADKLHSYLGHAIGVMPPPPFRNVNEIGLIYKKEKNLYYVDYLSSTIVNKKIDNIKRSDT